jgi:glutaredoxin 3
MTSVVVYGTKFCPFCVAARRLLTAKDIDFEDISVDGNKTLRAEIAERSGRATVPQIWIGEQHIGGYTDLQKLALSDSLHRLVNSDAKQPNAL